MTAVCRATLAERWEAAITLSSTAQQTTNGATEPGWRLWASPTHLEDRRILPPEQPGVRVALAHVGVGRQHGRHRAADNLLPAGRVGVYLCSDTGELRGDSRSLPAATYCYMPTAARWAATIQQRLLAPGTR